jgi:SAM-dependent methyltransferase
MDGVCQDLPMSDAAQRGTAASWDAEYRAGRYAAEGPVAFVSDILACVDWVGLPGGRGIYIGCGNGRNFVPLVEGGLDLIGLDVSAAALEQLAEHLPSRASDLLRGDLEALPPKAMFSIVVAIQVFQHGHQAETHAHILEAAGRVLPGGLICIRVNAAETDVFHRHRVVERNDDGGFTVVYADGPKAGLAIHFFAEAELSRLLRKFAPVLPLRAVATARHDAEGSQWVQWEGIWRRIAYTAPSDQSSSASGS